MGGAMMLRFLASLAPPWARVAGVLALLAAAAAWHAFEVRGAYRAGEAAERDRNAATRRAEEARARIELDLRAATARAAAATFEAQRTQQEIRNAQTARTLRDALARPLSCPSSAPGEVAGVLVPAAAVRSLRDAAGADVPGP